MSTNDSDISEDIEGISKKEKNFSLKPQSSKPVPKKAPELSPIILGLICCAYMFVSQILTIVNKFIYSTYKFKSPLNLLLL
jgi:hypothetical protein